MWLHAYWWLEGNGIYKAAVSWTVFTALAAAAAWLPWKRHRRTQNKIADHLDTTTPGGLTDLVEEVRKLDRGRHESHR